MDGRSALLAPLLLSLLLAGCANTQGVKKAVIGPGTSSTIVSTGGPTVPAAEVAPVVRPAAKKAKEEPMRDPRPETLVSLGSIAEGEGLQKKKNEPEHFVKAMDTARKYYQRALKNDPSCGKAQEGLVRVYTQLGEHHRAQEILRQGLEKNPAEARLWLELGMTYNRQKNFAEGIKSIRKAREIDPENVDYMKVMGYTLVRVDRVSEGLEHLIPALGKAAAHYNVAGIMRQQGRGEEAQQHLQQCLAADPGFKRAQDMLASLRSGAPAPTTPEVLPALGFVPLD